MRVGIIGCGNMGRRHTSNCNRMEGVSVASVVDVDVAKATSLGAEVDASVYDSTDCMLANAPIDAVIVAPPPDMRWEIVEAAAANRKATFVEKPIALDLCTAKACCLAAEEHFIPSAVGFHLRYSQLTREAQTLTANRPVTHVRTATTTPYYLNIDIPHWYLQRQHSGGPLLEQSIHMIDMARYLVDDINHVFARGDRLVRPDLDTFNSEDTLVLTYQFNNGALGTHIDSCAMAEFNWEIELFGPDWRLLVDYARNQLSGHINGRTIRKKFPVEDLHMLEMQAFLKAVRYAGNGNNNNGVLSNFCDATKTLAVVLAGDRSLKTGGWEPVEE